MGSRSSTLADEAAPDELDTATSAETENLLPAMAEMKHKDSVYSFMLFQPELSRAKHGHYWTPPVVLAGILLILNLTLQVGLSFIAGQYITTQHEVFTVTLVSNLDGPNALTPFARIKAEAEAIHTDFRKTLKESLHGKDTNGYCCNGAECSELEMQCCDRTGASPHEPHRPILRASTAAPTTSSSPAVVTESTGAPQAAASPAAAPSAAPPSESIPSPPAAAEASESEPTAEESESEPATTAPETKQAGSPPDLANFMQKPGGGGGKKAKKEEHEDGAEHIEISAKTSAICKLSNGTMDCAPSSFAFMGSWEDLDRDGDGLWTLEEARADEANLGCQLGMSVEEVFRSVCRGVVKDAKDTSDHSYALPFVPFSVEQRRAIPKVDFDRWRGLVTICVATDVARCSELVRKGVYDGVIGAPNAKSHRGGVVDLDSAVDYCQRLLVPGGICEKTLPGTYMMYRSRVSEKCGAPSYSPGSRYVNPHDNRDVMSIVSVSYSNVKEYLQCASFKFSFFLGLILFLWYTNLTVELNNIIQLGDFILNFPLEKTGANPLMTPNMREVVERATSQNSAIRTMVSATSLPGQLARHLSRSFSIQDLEDGLERDEVKKKGSADCKVIKSISRLHKGTCAVMFCVRLFLLIYMMDVGSTFLIYTKSYDDLLLNAVALAFIFDLPEFLYMFLVNNSIKGNLDDASCVQYPTSLPNRGWRGAMLNKSLWGIFLIPIMTVVQVIYNMHVNILPGLQALECTCFQEGETCKTAEFFKKSWWDNYWQDFSAVRHHGAL